MKTRDFSKALVTTLRLGGFDKDKIQNITKEENVIKDLYTQLKNGQEVSSEKLGQLSDNVRLSYINADVRKRLIEFFTAESDNINEEKKVS
ncbi:MAG: hypothetical protein LBP53_01060 [Candidatus Peribacteria bacterium]|nr:hypothetical protein [Candidatus Peribacteria bacterium]